MQVVLEVDAETEAKVRELAARGEYSAAKRELEGPLDAAVRRLTLPPLPPDELERIGDELVRVFTAGCAPDAKPLPPEEVDRLLEDWDRFTEEVARQLGPDHRPLPPEALTREGIYGDHP